MASPLGYFSARPRSEEEIAIEMLQRQKMDDMLQASPDWGRMAPQQKARFYADMGMLSPVRKKDWSQFASDTGTNLAHAGTAALHGADYLFNAGGRFRDGAIRTAQEAYKGNPYGAAMNATAMLASPLLPELAVGGSGMPDDWRNPEYVSPGNALALDIVTDPLTWYTAAGTPFGIAKKTFGVADDSGELIRQLISAGRYAGPKTKGAAAVGAAGLGYGLMGGE